MIWQSHCLRSYRLVLKPLDIGLIVSGQPSHLPAAPYAMVPLFPAPVLLPRSRNLDTARIPASAFRKPSECQAAEGLEV